jgi:hypothetical protein
MSAQLPVIGELVPARHPLLLASSRPQRET